jgi:RimJ/RimL family protein N-acetyltransferase
MAVISLRPVEAADLPLLLALYGSARAAELALVPWNDAQRRAFIQHQFNAQTAFYQSEYPHAVHSILLCDGEPCGRVYIDRRPHEIRMLDVSWLATESAEDAGRQLMADLQAEAQSAGLPLNLHLEPLSTLRACFERLGFVKVTESDTHALYEWRAALPSD